MKFRIKILICNMILIAVSFSICGVLMIQRSYRTALDSEIHKSMKQNQMIQMLLEQEIIKLVISGTYEDARSLKDSNSFDKFDEEIDFSILDEMGNSIWGRGDITPKEKTFLAEAREDTKQNIFFQIIDEKDNKVIAVISSLRINDEKVYVLSVSRIENLYSTVHSNLRYFQVMRMIVLAVSGILVYLIAFALTASLEKLMDSVAKISKGEYSVRTNVSTSDEIGDLADAFNDMAGAVEERMEQLRKETEKKEEFVANFTHEIKTPMTSIIGYADEIRRSPESSEQTVYDANYIYNEGMRLEKMSMKLFDLILLERTEIEMHTVWVQSLMEEVEQIIKPSFEKKQIVLDVQDMDVCVSGDYEMLKTVFINILDNAKKASEVGGKIEFVCKREPENKIVVSVRDYGSGIEKKDLDKICEMFYMADKSRSRSEGGAGLGLALADKIVKCHGGQMEIESEKEKGTRVSIYLQQVQETENEEI